MRCHYCQDIAVVNVCWYWAGRNDEELLCAEHHLLINTTLDEINNFISALEAS